MKQIFLIRHAKSEWDFTGLTDFDRPLSTRGHNDAPKMGKLLSSILPKFDIILSSTAQRAFSTAQYFAKALGIDEKAIAREGLLYLASESSILKVIRDIDNSNQNVCIFGHNPGLSDLAASFLNEYLFAEIPTCGVVKLILHDSDWKNFNTKNVTFEKYWFPKDILEEYSLGKAKI